MTQWRRDKLMVIVEAGDTLSAIALGLYGDAGFWPDLARRNRLRNPHLIFPGQRLFV